jgi:hypothetical protein
MCIAIFKPFGTEITDEILRRCFNKNSDGCGCAFIKTTRSGKRQISIIKGLDFDTWLPKFREAEESNPSSNFLIHFRIKTHGKIDLDNCHPFVIDNRHVFIHNGMISGVGTDANKSDTRLFNDKILRTLPKDWMGSMGTKTLIEDFIGFGSKLVIMNLDGDVEIYNEDRGEWADTGIWYSNSGYKAPKQSSHKGSRTGSSSYVPKPSRFDTTDEVGESTWNTMTRRWERYNTTRTRWEHYSYWNDTWYKIFDRYDEEATDDAVATAKDDKVVYLPSAQDSARDTFPGEEEGEDLFDLTQSQIDDLAAAAGFSVHDRDFNLEVENRAGHIENLRFVRCCGCLDPEYWHLMDKYEVEGIKDYMCLDCVAWFRLEGMKPTKVQS